MPDVCAAIGLAQIRKYQTEILEERKRVFLFYSQYFATQSWAIVPPYNQPGICGSYHLYPLRIKNATEAQRDAIIDLIANEGVSVNVHFIPLPMLTVFKNMGYKMEDYPIALDKYSNEISLPIYPQLDNKLCEHIVNTITNAVLQIIE